MHLLRRMIRYIALPALLALLVACGGTGAAPQPATVAPASGAKPTVIATTTQLEDVVGVIAGDRVSVVGLVPRNGDPHEFEPTPDDVKKVADSQAVFKNGAGLETWLDKLIENAGGQRSIFDTSQGQEIMVIDRGADADNRAQDRHEPGEHDHCRASEAGCGHHERILLLRILDVWRRARTTSDRIWERV